MLPALLALSPYGKELQAQALTLPPQARPSVLWNGAIEAGDIRAVVVRGYAHVIADVRGTGWSDGELCGNYDSGGHGEGKDIYDIVEWMATQAWCDGNIGMIGISYFATVQILGANPDDSKVLIVSNSHTTDKAFTVQWGDQAFTYALPKGTIATFTWAGTQPISNIPTPPTDLKIKKPGDSLMLTWEFSPLADSYTIKRADTPGGPYTVLATDVRVPEYFDTETGAGGSYSYVVSAVNTFGESSDSAEASTTP